MNTAKDQLEELKLDMIDSFNIVTKRLDRIKANLKGLTQTVKKYESSKT